MTPQGSHAGVNLHSSEGTATIVLSGEPTEEVGGDLLRHRFEKTTPGWLRSQTELEGL